MAITSEFPDMTSSSNFCEAVLILLSILVTGPIKSHVNIITGSGVMTISFYKGLSRNSAIEDMPV